MRLTPRQKRILQMLAGGYNRREIAYSLHCSHSTIGTHVYNICRRLHARNATEAVATAIRLNYVDLEEAYLSIIAKRHEVTEW